MKVKVSKQEIRECVENAVIRLVKEGKSSVRKFKDNDGDFGGKPKKHGKLGTPKQKGGANRQRWTDGWDDDE